MPAVIKNAKKSAVRIQDANLAVLACWISVPIGTKMTTGGTKMLKKSNCPFIFYHKTLEKQKVYV